MILTLTICAIAAILIGVGVTLILMQRRVDRLADLLASHGKASRWVNSDRKLLRNLELRVERDALAHQTLYNQVNADLPRRSIREGFDGQFQWVVGNVRGSTNSYEHARSVVALETACQYFDIPLRQPARVQQLSEWSSDEVSV